jgi:outer membrane lipoprotein-sorting protein
MKPLRLKPSRLCFALTGLILVFALAAQAAPSGEELLHAMMQAEKTVSYAATETVTRAVGATTVARLQKSGGKKRLEYSRPAIMRGDILLDDGKNLWRYHRAENSAIKTKTASAKTLGWSAMRGRFTATVKEKTSLGGRAAWVVVVTPKKKAAHKTKFWIDEKTKIRLRLQRFDGTGKTLETIALSNLKFGAVPASTFRWSPPKGAKVTNAGTLYHRLEIARRNAPWLAAPTKLPAGYAFESAVVNTSDAWLRYSNGVRRFSIFQQRIAQAGSTPLRRAGSGWYWQKGKNRFLIAGLSKTQAQAVAQSVR